MRSPFFLAPTSRQACTGAPMAYNQLTHEMRVDATSPDRRVLTTAVKMAYYPKTHVSVKEGLTAAENVKCDVDRRVLFFFSLLFLAHPV